MHLTTASPLSSAHCTDLSNPLVVPLAHLSVHTVTLPPLPLHRLQGALAGALEEQLLDDPVDLHFALAPNAARAQHAGQPFEVMVCHKAWLQERIAQHRQQGHAVQRIVPDDATLQAAGWDLAQFEFRPTSQWQSRYKAAAAAVWHGNAWRWARKGAVLLVVIHIVGINLWAWRDRAELADKRLQISRILTQTFPQTQTVVDAPVQMERAVAALRSSSGALSNKDFERLLADTASNVSANKPLIKIDYANGALTVQVAP